MAEEMQAIDIPDDGADPAAAAAQPDRHGFWAWGERVMSRNHGNDPIVVAAEPSKRGRVLYFCFAVLLDAVILTISGMLLALCDAYRPATMAGRALQVAGRVAGVSCVVVGSVGYFFVGVFIAGSVPRGNLHQPRTIDFFMQLSCVL
jgi:hypothetical protein